jgi:hypothetical protein
LLIIYSKENRDALTCSIVFIRIINNDNYNYKTEEHHVQYSKQHFFPLFDSLAYYIPDEKCRSFNLKQLTTTLVQNMEMYIDKTRLFLYLVMRVVLIFFNIKKYLSVVNIFFLKN